MHIIRWLLIIPVAILGWCVGALAGMTILQFNELLCPDEYFYDEMCHAPWSSFVYEFAWVFGIVTAACLVVLLPTLTAPFHRRQVAIIAYITGLEFAIYYAAQGTGLIWPAVWAALGGGITLWLIHRVLNLRS